MKVAGVMSGTSVDGIDVAIVQFNETFKVLGHYSVAYPSDVREAILAVSNSNTHTASIARLSYVLGELYAEAVRAACEQIRMPLSALDLIGCHGQTIFHEGKPVEYLGRRVASTMQIGEPAVIAKRTGVLTIADFRADDVAVGGQGAPMVPLMDYWVFRSASQCRITLNLGGIANITVIPVGARIEDVLAFDTGPANMVMDQLMGEARFDRGGEVGRRGKVDQKLLNELLADPYYEMRPPKTAGREQYGGDFVNRFAALSREDAVATAAELTVETIARAVQRYPDAAEIIAAGGGTCNPFLMERLRARLQIPLKVTEDYGIPAEAKEAIAFAILAYESFHGRPGNVPSATGAQRAVVLGKRVAG